MNNVVANAGLYHRDAEIIPESIEKEKRVITFCWSTGSRVLRVPWFEDPFYEELSLEEQHVRLHRLNNHAPFLQLHRSGGFGDALGVHQKAWIEGNKAFAEVRFSKRKGVEEIWGEVCDGILRNISVGYKTHKIREEKQKNDFTIKRAIDWEPFENSLVLVGADADAQIRSEESRKIFYPIQIRSDGMEEKDTNSKTEETAAPKNPPPMEKQEDTNTKAISSEEMDRIASEARRLACEINSMCDRHSVPQDLRGGIVSESKTLQEAGARILDYIGKRSEEQMIKNPHNIHLGTCEKESRRDGLKNALLHRCDASKPLDENGKRFRSYSLLDFAMEATGIQERGQYSKHEIVTRSFHSTSDFPELLGDVAHTVLKQSYQSYIQKQNFWDLVKIRSASDFRPFKSARIGEIPTLEYLPEGGEYKYSTISEEGHEWKIHTYGRAFGLSRQAIINDNLDAFEKLSAWGYAAARLESKLFWSIFNDNQKIVAKGSKEKPLFSSDHGNIAKTKSKISVKSLSEARVSMMRQKGLDARDGDILDIHAEYLIVPPELQTLAEQYMTGGEFPDKPEDKNTFRGAYKIIVSSWLKDPNAWYLAASKSQGIDLIEMAYLDGVREPYVAWDTEFEKDVFRVKARLDVGCRAIDYRGFCKNEGVAS